MSFKYEIYSPYGTLLRTVSTAKELDSKGRLRLKDRESNKYGARVRIGKPSDESIKKYAEDTKYN